MALSGKLSVHQIPGLVQPSQIESRIGEPDTGEPDTSEPNTDALTHRMAWIRAHQQSVWRYLRWLGADPAAADDLTQDTFLLALQKQIENRGHARARSFLCRTAKNLWLRSQRNQRAAVAVAHEVDILWAQAMQSPAATDDNGEHLREALRSCLRKLRGRPAEVVRLFYRSDMTREGVALQMGLRPDGVKTLLRRTRQQLKTCIEQETKR